MAAGLAVLAGACGRTGGGTDGASGGQVQTAVPVELTAGYLAKVADTTTAAHTGKVKVTSETKGSVKGIDIHQTVSGSGSYDVDARTASMTISTSAMGKDLTIDSITSGTAAYERSSFFSMLLPSVGDKWIKISVADATSGLALAGGGSFGAASSDPAAMLDNLRAAGATVDDRGMTDIDGTAVHHLHTVASLANLGGKVSDERMKQLEQGFGSVPGAEALKNLSNLQFDLDVYVDADNHVRRLEVASDMSAILPAGSTLAMHETVDYSDFGQPVTIAVPADADTVDGMTLLRSFGKAFDGSSSSSSGATTPTTTR